MSRPVLALLVWIAPALAGAQEARRFNVEELEAQLAPLAVFHQKGKVVDNEVVITREEPRQLVEAVYVAQADLAKVLDFYRARLSLPPQKQGDEELGTVRYLFAPKARRGDKRVCRAIVEPIESKRVQVTLSCRALTEDDQVLEEDGPAAGSIPAVDPEGR